MSKTIKTMLGLIVLVVGWALGTLVMQLGASRESMLPAMLLIIAGAIASYLAGYGASLVWMHGDQIYQDVRGYLDRRKARKEAHRSGW